MSTSGYERPIGPWPRKETPLEAIRLITPEELRAWILFEDEHLLVLNKPGDVVCHPSKAGPWSSLVGAAREYLGGGAVHLIFRLDRETSGVVLIAKDERTNTLLQRVTLKRCYSKAYHAILVGELAVETTVDQPLGPDCSGPVVARTCVVPAGQGKPAVTRYTPLAVGGGFTLARVVTETGRKHQIRAHAQWLGYPLVGDKIYGPDQRLYLEFIERGWTPALESRLLLRRQALHCAEIALTLAGEERVFRAGLPDDLAAFAMRCMGEAARAVVAGLAGREG
ncbi:MAG: RluA family pseudouridine synthase [Opitutaceae bacterium]|nr:RluA family pseudouridine synthase [Opitutaceae bacterium]